MNVELVELFLSLTAEEQERVLEYLEQTKNPDAQTSGFNERD